MSMTHCFSIVGIAMLATHVSSSVSSDPSRVLVEQFGMVQCPMTSTWLNHFHQECLIDGEGVDQIINFTEFFVGGKHGGHVDNSSWNTSFHGPQEILGDKYHLCARVQAGDTTLDVNRTWMDFEVCMNGPAGILKPWTTPIPTAAQNCAEILGLDWNSLDACAKGDEGTALYKSSVFYTSSQGINYVAGKIPVIRIAGSLYHGLDAYSKLGERICAAYTGDKKLAKCGCGKDSKFKTAFSEIANDDGAKATVTLTHYSDAQCPCSARVPNDIQTTFLGEDSGFEGAVKFEQYFVGDLRKNVSKCIHGEEECVAQRHFACAQNQSTRGEWIKFEMCSYGKCTGCAAIEGPHCPCETYTTFTDYASNDIMKECAATAGLDWKSLHSCGVGAGGQTLMEASSARSNQDGITYGVDGLAPIYLDGVKVKTKKMIPLVCGPTPDEVKSAVCSALAAKGSNPVACTS